MLPHTHIYAYIYSTHPVEPLISKMMGPENLKKKPILLSHPALHWARKPGCCTGMTSAAGGLLVAIAAVIPVLAAIVAGIPVLAAIVAGIPKMAAIGTGSPVCRDALSCAAALA